MATMEIMSDGAGSPLKGGGPTLSADLARLRASLGLGPLIGTRAPQQSAPPFNMEQDVRNQPMASSP